MSFARTRPNDHRSITGSIAKYLVALVMLFLAFAPVAFAADIPDDDDQEVLIRTTLMTFNDANMTGNYAVLLAKSSKEFQAQVSAEKLFTAFEGFRKNELFFEDIVYEDYDSFEKAKIDGEGALVLAGVFKSKTISVNYKLRFIKNGDAWKMLGINVKADKL